MSKNKKIKIRKHERGCWDATLPMQGYGYVVMCTKSFEDAMRFAEIHIKEERGDRTQATPADRR